MMGGGELIGCFLDEGAIDEFIISVIRRSSARVYH